MGNVRLYRDTENGNLYTFSELKEMYADEVQAELPVDDDTFSFILLERLVQNGGKYMLIKDEILNWCNDYANNQDADKHLTRIERETSTRDIYECIDKKDNFLLEEVMKTLREEHDEESNKLLSRLKELCGGK